jgi:hypothetical protein
MAEITPTEGFVPNLTCHDYFTPEARTLCARVKHKSELTDDETLMLALVAAQAALARYWHPGLRSAEETLETVGAILDHEDVVGALNRKIELDERQKRLLWHRLELSGGAPAESPQDQSPPDMQPAPHGSSKRVVEPNKN